MFFPLFSFGIGYLYFWLLSIISTWMMIELSQHLEMGLSDFVHMLVRLSQFGTYLIFVKKVELSGKPFPKGYIVQTKISSKICRVSLFYSNIAVLTLSDAGF